jgi:hypothetical protein
MVVLMRLIVGNPPWRRRVMIAVRMAEIVITAAVRSPKPGGGVAAVAESEHGEVLSDHVSEAKGRRTPQHNCQAEDVATVSLWLPRQDPEQSNNGQQLHDHNQHHQGRVVFSMSGSSLSGIADRHGSGDGNPAIATAALERG